MTETQAPSFPLALTTDVHAAFVRWAYGLFGYEAGADDCKRPVFATPYPGCYGRAGYVLTINGSPPRATVMIEPASGQLVAFRAGRIVRGSANVDASRAARARYGEAIAWLKRFALTVPKRGL